MYKGGALAHCGCGGNISAAVLRLQLNHGNQVEGFIFMSGMRTHMFSLSMAVAVWQCGSVHNSPIHTCTVFLNIS